MIDENIFREYDIRGEYGKNLDEKIANIIGKAFAQYIGGGDVVVGGDVRNSTETLREALIEGLCSGGCNVIDIKVVPTPTFYFALHYLNYPNGVQITASHNPPQYNGFKLCRNYTTIYGKEIQQLKENILATKTFPSKTGGKREYKDDILDIYIETVSKKLGKLQSKPKVVIDCGNGCAGLVAPQILERIGAQVITLYGECDGNFPNHFPDPTVVEYLTDLREGVKTNKADVGIGYDGDVDRLGVIDEMGEIVWGDMLMILFFREILEKYPNSPCLVEVKCSQALYDDTLKHGGKPFFYKTGHSLIKAKMREVGAVFAGELSGHMYFADEYYGFDDAVYASGRLLRIMDRTGKSLTQLLADVPKYYSTPEIQLHCPDEYKQTVVEKITEEFKREYECIDVDGVRVKFPDGAWGLLRKSNTGPNLILRFEAPTQERLNQIKQLFLEKLQEFNYVNISPLK